MWVESSRCLSRFFTNPAATKPSQIMIPAYRISADSSLPYNLPKAPYSVQVITIFHNGFSAESTLDSGEEPGILAGDQRFRRYRSSEHRRQEAWSNNRS